MIAKKFINIIFRFLVRILSITGINLLEFLENNPKTTPNIAETSDSENSTNDENLTNDATSFFDDKNKPSSISTGAITINNHHHIYNYKSNNNKFISIIVLIIGACVAIYLIK